MKFDLPIKTVSTLNRREHWSAAAKRKASQRKVVHRYTAGLPRPSTPCLVLLTRHSAGVLDAHDNLPSAFKHIVDELADWIGVDDGGGLVEWRYDQARCARGQGWVTVEVTQ